MLFFFFNDTATTEIYTLSLHDALPISAPSRARTLEAGQGLGRLAQHRAASRPGLCAIATGRRAGAPPVWKLTRSFPVQACKHPPAASLFSSAFGALGSKPGTKVLPGAH